MAGFDWGPGGDGAAEAFFEGDGGGEVEQSLRFGNVGDGMTDIAGSFWAVFDAGGYTEEGGEDFEQGVQRDPGSRSGFEDVPGGCGFFDCEQIGANDVCDVDEIAGLFAIAIDDGGTVGHDGFDEFGDDRGVGGRGRLAGSVDIELAQGDGFESVRLVEHTAEVFGGEKLLGEIGPVIVRKHYLDRLITNGLYRHLVPPTTD